MFSLCVGITSYQSNLSYIYRYTQLIFAQILLQTLIFAQMQVLNKNTQFLFNDKSDLGTQKKLQKTEPLFFLIESEC